MSVCSGATRAFAWDLVAPVAFPPKGSSGASVVVLVLHPLAASFPAELHQIHFGIRDRTFQRLPGLNQTPAPFVAGGP